MCPETEDVSLTAGFSGTMTQLVDWQPLEKAFQGNRRRCSGFAYPGTLSVSQVKGFAATNEDMCRRVVACFRN